MQAVRLSDVITSRDNNLNLLRLLSALAVIVAHSYPLALGPVANIGDPFQRAFGINLGTIAVDIFFFTSGLLVTRSILAKTDYIFFIVSRVIRIFPGLIVSVFFSALIIGSAVTTLPFLNYIGDVNTISYLSNNIWIFDNIIQFGLPGVFASLPYQNAVNGSLWTLPWEVYMYGLLLCISFFGFFKFKKIALSLFLLFSLLPLLPYAISYSGIAYDLSEYNNLFRFLSVFFMGGVFVLCAPYIVISIYGVFSIVLLWVFFYKGLLLSVFYPLILGYLVIFFSYGIRGFILGFNRFGDYSYGVYIYAFPVQQLCAYFISGISPVSMMIISTPITLILASISWHFVEEPFLLKKLILAKKCNEIFQRLSFNWAESLKKLLGKAGNDKQPGST